MSATTIPTPGDLIQTLKFPFSDKRWIQKVLVGLLLTLASFIILLIPAVFLVGYYFRVSRRIISDDGQAVLPEWNDWGKLFVDGIRYIGVSFIYSLPLSISAIAMYLVMFLPMLPALGLSQGWNGNGLDPSMMSSFLTPIMMLFMYPMMSLMMLISLATCIFLPPALMHMIARDSFGAAFQFSQWWKIFRANFGGYVIAFLMAISIFAMLYLVYYILALSIVLCCLAPIIVGTMAVYSGLITSALFAQAYRTGADKLRVKSELAVAPVKVVPAGVKKTVSTGTGRKRKTTP